MFKKKPVSPGINRPQDLLDPVDYKVYNLLFYIKCILIVLFVYLIFLTLNEGIFMFESINDNAVGSTKGVQRPWLSKPTYNISNQDLNLELSSVTINM